MHLTRRELGGLAIALVPAGLLPARLAAQGARKPNSKFAGVQVGLNVPYNFGGREMDPDEVLSRCLTLNVNALELRSQPVEAFLGSPGSNGRKATPDEMTKWRTSVQVDRAAAFRKKYESAGVLIEIVKYDGIYAMADAEVDYCFNLAKTLGARAISCEIDAAHTERIGQFADKHKMMVGLSRPRGDDTRPLGGGVRAGEVQLGESGHRPLRRRQQHVTGAVPQAAPRAHHARARQGSQDERRRQHAVRPGRHADRGSAAADPRQQVADSGDDRVRYPVPAGIRSHGGDREDDRITAGQALVS